MTDKQAKGIYQKFLVTRVDGRDAAGQKHEHCQYFVLDLQCDEFAPAALKAYARACRKRYPTLADDLLRAAAVGAWDGPETLRKR